MSSSSNQYDVKNRKKRLLPDFPDFQWNSIEEEEELGNGTFGTVSLATWEQEKVVVKKMKIESRRTRSRFEKEAGILFTVRDHKNISKFLRICREPYSIMMEYSCFDFRPFGLQDKVSSLEDFLFIVDEHCNFVSFEHFIPVCARDVLTGLEYLHSQGIAHRDLKPNNVLVCNQHYSTKEDSDDLKAECPIVCKLADFGLSRSLEMQTNSTLQTTTEAIRRGTPVFMAPEIHLEILDVASQEDLVKADMWSLGFIMYFLVNPHIDHPYRAHFKRSGIPFTEDAMKVFLRQKQLPSHDKKYELLRITQWWQLEDVFMSCAKFDPSLRPTAAEALCLLDKNWLKTSLRLVNLSVGMNQNAGETPGKKTSCRVLSVALSICDQFLKKLEMKVDVPWENFKEIVENAITSLPSKISKNSADSQQYDVFEAKTQLKELNILSCDYELTEACVSGNAVFSDGGRDDVSNALADRLDQDTSSIAIYTCSLLPFLVGKHNDVLFLVDLNGLLITTPDCSQQSRHLLTQWILTQLCNSGVSGKEFQSIIWVTPIKAVTSSTGSLSQYSLSIPAPGTARPRSPRSRPRKAVTNSTGSLSQYSLSIPAPGTGRPRGPRNRPRKAWQSTLARGEEATPSYPRVIRRALKLGTTKDKRAVQLDATSQKKPDAIKEGNPSWDELEVLSTEIASLWKRLGRRLKVTEAKLFEIDQANLEDYAEKSYKMLLHWKQRDGEAATFEVLFNALCHGFVGRNDLAEKYCLKILKA